MLKRLMIQASGSVLMEFIIVLPIYFLLIGFVFVSGELMLQSIRLAGQADRSLSLGEESVMMLLTEVDNPTYNEIGKQSSSYRHDIAQGVFAEGFPGAWVKFVRAKAMDDYTLTPLTRGFVAFWYHDNDRKMERTSAGAGEDVMGGDNPLEEMLNEEAKRVEMIGKNLGDRKYGHYMLVRSEQGRISEDRQPYRTWPAGNLLPSEWRRCGRGDGVAELLPEVTESKLEEILASGVVAPEKVANLRKDYSRDERFSQWSAVR